MFIKSINAQPDDNQACRVSFSTEQDNTSITGTPNLNENSGFLFKKVQGRAAEGEERAKLPGPVVSLYKPYTCLGKKGSDVQDKVTKIFGFWKLLIFSQKTRFRKAFYHSAQSVSSFLQA